MRAIRAHNNAVWFENKKGGDITLNVPRLNQPSQALARNLVGRPVRKEKIDLKPLQVQLPPPLKDINQYQVINNLEEENKNNEQQALIQSQDKP